MAVDEVKVAEIKAKMKQRGNLIRELWVKAMELRLVQNELAKCHQAEGVNHYENCRMFSERYLRMLKDSRVKGYKVIDV